MDYPFASFFDCCKISSSQEEFLNHCKFFCQAEGGLGFFSSEEPSQSEEIPTPDPGIIICSPPDDSDEEGSQAEEFRTPPEEPLRTSYDEQKGNLDERVDSRLGDTDVVRYDSGDDVDDSPDASGTVDRGKDSDLGFSQEKSLTEKGLSLSRVDGFADCADISGKVCVDAASRSELKSLEASKAKSPEKGKLGFSEGKREIAGKSSSKIPGQFKENLNLESAEADSAVDVSGEPNRESFAEKKLGHLVLKTFTRPNIMRESSKGFQKNDTLAVKINNRNDSHEQMGEILFGKSNEKSPVKRKLEFSNSEVDFHCTSVTEVLQSADVANSDCVPDFGEGTIKEYSPLKVTEAGLGLNLSTEKDSLNSNGGGDSFTNSAEWVRTFKYLEPISVVPPEIPKSRGIPRLPESICEQVKDTTEGFVSGNSSSNDQLVINLLETVNLLSGGRKHTLEDVDLLETVKRRGMTFPRPRWWTSGSN